MSLNQAFSASMVRKRRGDTLGNWSSVVTSDLGIAARKPERSPTRASGDIGVGLEWPIVRSVLPSKALAELLQWHQGVCLFRV
jgi:hypothetical protein